MINKKSVLSILLVLLMIVSSGCVKTDGTLGESTVVINLGLDQAFNAPRTKFDRFMNFFMPKAYAAPSNIASVSILVSAEDIKTIESSYSPAPTYVTLTVPAGAARYIQVIGYVKEGDPGAALSYRGTLTTDLDPGEIKEVTMKMVTYETKLVIPDGYLNYRIVQMDDITGSGWIAKVNTDMGLVNPILPYDLDFDARGRIFFPSYNASGLPAIIRLDNINSTATSISTASNVSSIAIDRIRDIIYYSTGGTTVARTDYNGNSPVNVVTGLTAVQGLAVDESGMLYVTFGSAGTSTLRKYNPDNGSLIASFTSNLNFTAPPGSSGTFADIIVKDNYAYLSNTSGASGYKVMKFDLNLNLVQRGGSSVTAATSTAPGSFYGPSRFIAITNRKFYITEDDTVVDGTDYDRLVSFDDIDNMIATWTTYGSSGSGVGRFRFYNDC